MTPVSTGVKKHKNSNLKRERNVQEDSSILRHLSEFSCLAIFIGLVLCLVVVLVKILPQSVNKAPSCKLLREVVAGGVSASIASLIFFPINVVSIRLQTASSDDMKKSGVFKMMKIIFRSEGVQGLWGAGIVAACLKSFIHQGLRLGLFPSAKTSIITHLSLFTTLIYGYFYFNEQSTLDNETNEPHLFLKIVAGMITGGLSASLCSPLDLVEVLMNSEGRYRYTNSIDAMQQVFRKQGFQGLWKAGTLTTFRASVASGSQLAFYDYAKDFTAPYAQGPFGHFIPIFTSICAAVAYSLVATPIDLLKVRIMALNNANQSVDDKNDERNTKDIFLTASTSTVSRRVPSEKKKEIGKSNHLLKIDITSEKGGSICNQVFQVIKSEGGVFSLWRGFWPATLRLIPVVLLVFPLMEQMRLLLGVGSY